MSDLSVLPHNAKPLERDLERLDARTTSFPVPMYQLWDPDTCPEHLLPWLAWALSVDDWDPEWPTETRRRAVLASIGIHRRKGTIGSVREAIRAFGYGEAVIVEGFQGFSYDGSIIYDGSEVYGAPDHWAEYRVFMERPISIGQAAALRRILGNVAPARCHLKGLYFTEVAHLYDGAITYDGTFTYGVVQ